MSQRLAALRSHDFRLLFFGQLISLTGSQMQIVGVTWQLYELTRSPLALGTIGLVRVLPVVLFALGGGVVADAMDRRRLMLLSQSLMALSSLALALATMLGHVTPPLIYAVIACSGAAFAFDSPARHGLIPALVPREHLPNAYSLYATALEMAAVGGPALGGMVLARFGVGPIYFIDAGSFLAVIAALVAMQHRHVAPTEARVDFRAALDGLRFIVRTPLILWTMVIDAIATFFAGSLLLMPLYADRILHTGPRGLGLLYAAPSIGAVIAAAIMSVRPTIRRQGHAVLIAIAIYGVAITGFGVSRWLGLSLLLLAISGAADTVSMVIRQTLRQLLTPDELRGRMTSVNMIFFMGGPQLGEFEAGVVARVVGPRFSVASGGILCVAVAVVAAIAIPSLRTLSTEDQRANEPT